MIRIIIADDHIIVCRGLVQIVDDEGDMTVVGEAHDAEELLALVRKVPCDVVVTDISMPGKSGLDALKELKQEWPDLPVLVLSMHPEDQFAARALRMGASGYLTKESVAEELGRAIRKLVTGGTYVRPSFAAKLVSDLATDTGQPLHNILSQREHQVLCLIGSGMSVRRIAHELSVGVKTIRTYRVRILKKMTMKNNAELMHYAISKGLVNAPQESSRA
jgi:two-component system, NarL family, invasion response regulator UvrY